MHGIQNPGDGTALATAQTALTVPPAAGAAGITWADVESAGWNAVTYGNRMVPEFDLELWAATATGVAMTVAHLYAGTLHPWVQADIAIDSVTNATETLNEAAHTLLTGDGPVRLTTAGTMPNGLAAGVDYWVIKTGAGTFKLAASLALALTGTPVAFSDDGSGQLTLSDTPTTTRIHWHDCGLLGPAGDGAITLAAQVAYVERCRHHPFAVAYTIAATYGAGSVSARLVRVQE